MTVVSAAIALQGQHQDLNPRHYATLPRKLSSATLGKNYKATLYCDHWLATKLVSW